MEHGERYQFPLFEGVPASEVQWMIDHSEERQVAEGEVFFQEGVPNNEFCIVLEGEMQISRIQDGRERVVGTTPRGIIGGEIGLLYNRESRITSRAIVPTTLMVFQAREFRAMFGAAPTIASRVLEIGAKRTQGFTTNAVQQEKMAALGKLSAGLAHELNNPAAAARRSADSLRETLPTLQAQIVRLNSLGLSHDQINDLVACQQELSGNATDKAVLSPLEQSDREDTMGDWLEEHDIARAWDLAAGFVNANVSVEQLDGLAAKLPSDSLSDVFQWLYTALEATTLLNEMQQSTQRISDLVGAIKSYTYLDRGAVQDVDINKGLDTTLAVLKYKLKKGSITLSREYDPKLPHIQARGGELNQVWTNLIDNAIDALSGEGHIQIITRAEKGFVMVEVTDDGPGIPADVQPRIFEPFFTTKEVGSGTGLGLDITYRIIQEHHGSIEVETRPGCTRFIVRLPEKAVGDT